MAFQTKSFLSITASMINRMRAVTQRVTDYNVGSVVRTMLEAVAQEIDELYQQLLNGLREAIPVSVYNSFNFSLLPAVTASGPIRVIITAQSDVTTISTSDVFTPQSGGTVTYSPISPAYIAAGSTYVDVPVVASVTGAAGNLAAGNGFTMSTTPPGFTSATNLVAFTNGADTETDDSRKLRFQNYVSTLSRSTLASLEYGLSTVTLTDTGGNITERVAFSKVIEPYDTDETQPTGLINCYVHNGVGSTSTALVAQSLLVIKGYTDATGTKIVGYKAAGVKVTMAAAAEQDIAVTGVITVSPVSEDAVAIAAVEEAIGTYILGLDIGAPCLVAEIIALAMAVTDVTNITLSTPTSDTTADAATKLMPGAITITASA